MTHLEEIKENGYTTIWDKSIVELINSLSTDVESVAQNSKFKDVFLCEHGIKQIQNLNNRPVFKTLAIKLKALIGEWDAKVLNMQYFIKYPNYKITSPHQDGFYFDAPDKQILTFWIPLQDVEPNNSCMFYVTGSHKNGVLPHEAVGTKVRTRTGKTGYSQYCQKYSLDQFEAVPLKKGEIVVHDQFSVHYSSENHTNQRRIAVTCIVEIKKPKPDKYYVALVTTHTRTVPGGSSGFFEERWSWKAYEEDYLSSKILKDNFKSEEDAQKFIDQYIKEHTLNKNEELRFANQRVMKTETNYRSYLNRIKKK